MDPQQRLLLEASGEALARGGVAAGAQRVGAYVGIANSDYGALVQAHTSPGALHATSNALSVAAGRLAFVFGLQGQVYLALYNAVPHTLRGCTLAPSPVFPRLFRAAGPALSVDTACSASLLALHLAAQTLRHPAEAGVAQSAALVAGCHVQATPTSSAYVWSAGMLSPQGRCQVLDAEADGYVRGEAVVALVLQCASGGGQDAPASPLALLAGSAVNQDGRSSALTAPNGPAQQVRRAPWRRRRRAAAHE